MKFENKKWVLRVALAGALSLGVASVAKADARLDGMGVDVRQVDDVDAIWLYPNEILQYKNTVDFRMSPTGLGSGLGTAGTLGTGNNEWGGVIHDLGDDFGTIATYVNRPNNLVTASSLLLRSSVGQNQAIFAGSGVVGGATNAFAPTNNVDVFWGKDIFGLHLNYGDNENMTGLTTAGKVASQEFGLALGVNLGSSFLMSQSQFHVDYAFDSLTDNSQAAPANDNGVYTIKLGWLGQSALNDKDNARVYVDAQYDNDSLPTITGGEWNSRTANDAEVLLGGSIKHNITDRGFVNTGLNLEYDGGNSTTNSNYSSWTAIWNGSVESSVSSWLTVRTGLSKAIFNRSYNSTGTPSAYDGSLVGGGIGGTSTNNNVTFNAGLSATAENFTLDAQISVAKLDAGVAAPSPGAGVFFVGAAASPELIAVSEADLRYKF